MKEIAAEILPYVLTALGGIISVQFSGVRKDIKKMADSINSLNEKIAVIITDQQWHKEQIEEIKSRLSKVEGE